MCDLVTHLKSHSIGRKNKNAAPSRLLDACWTKTTGVSRKTSKKKYLFLHNPKVAGTSIVQTLKPNKSIRTISSVETIMAQNPYIFTFVRDPWDRIASAFVFVHKEKNTAVAVELFRKFVKEGKIWEEDGTPVNAHWSPQWAYVQCKCGISFCDFVGKFENIKEEWEDLAQTLNVPLELPTLNKTSLQNINYRDFYDSECRDIISKMYEKDIKLFGYEW